MTKSKIKKRDVKAVTKIESKADEPEKSFTSGIKPKKKQVSELTDE